MTSHARLIAGGTSRRRIAASLTDGSLERMRRGVYVRSGSCDGIRAAAAHGGILACVSAARHVGLWVLSEDKAVHVWLGGHGHAYRHGGCTCTEHWDDGPVGLSALPTVPRILERIHRCRGIEEFFVALESALRRGLITAAELAWLQHRGGEAVRDAIDFARRDADSGLESLLRWRLRRHGLRIRSQVQVFSVGRVDFLIGDSLIVEVDGRENHDSASNRHKDLVRDANAAMWGYVSLRFDYALIVHDWDAVERAILAHVDRGLHVSTRS